jgi:DNA sulfur modification protein DndC
LGPAEFRNLELISLAELHEIRRIWLYEKHEFQDSLPRIYQEVTGQDFPKPAADDNLLRSEDWEILREVCQDDEEFFQLQTGLLDIEREFRGMARRAGIYEALEERLRAGQFGSEEEALAIRQEEERRRDEAMIRKDLPHGTPVLGRPRTLFEECEAEEVTG